jgi:hypothetical protein
MKDLDEAMMAINKRYKYRYDTPQNVEQIRQLTNGAVIFQGQTFGGDVGADLYAHVNKNGNIDSLIIDNGHFFAET